MEPASTATERLHKSHDVSAQRIQIDDHDLDAAAGKGVDRCDSVADECRAESCGVYEFGEERTEIWIGFDDEDLGRGADVSHVAVSARSVRGWRDSLAQRLRSPTTLSHGHTRLRRTPHRRSVLLVERDSDLALMFIGVLSSQCERVEHASSTTQALLALARDHHDVVVIDLDGLERPDVVLDAAARHAAVVLAGPAGGQAACARDAGMRWVFEKPIEIETLLTAVATAAP